jgi:trimethylamine-N-oxide reductase (cytochrome c)
VVTSGFLVELEKVDLTALDEKYPGSFKRDYDPACGLVFEAWVEP